MINGREESEGELALVTTAIRAIVTRLLRENETSPWLIACLLARVAGELGAEASLAVGTEIETSLDVLAEALRRAGADRHVAPRPDLDPSAPARRSVGGRERLKGTGTGMGALPYPSATRHT